MSKGNEGRVPYQFWVDWETKQKALNLVYPSGMDLSTFMRMALEQFVERPLAESVALLEKHNKRKGRK